jgi:hypothetical protein
MQNLINKLEIIRIILEAKVSKSIRQQVIKQWLQAPLEIRSVKNSSYLLEEINHNIPMTLYI